MANEEKLREIEKRYTHEKYIVSINIIDNKYLVTVQWTTLVGSTKKPTEKELVIENSFNCDEYNLQDIDNYCKGGTELMYREKLFGNHTKVKL